jgi:hypothetical protein
MRAIFAVVVLAACTTESTSSVEPTSSMESEVLAKKKNKVVTVVRTNGREAEVSLFDPGTDTQGTLVVSRDEVEDTTNLSFSYFRPDPAEPTIQVVRQGVGEIPNNALQITDQNAHLTLAATPFTTIECRVDTVEGTSTCDSAPPVGFDLTWVSDGFIIEQFREKSTRKTGPVTVKSKGERERRSALVDGTFGGNTATNMSGFISDSQQTTITREVTVEMD